MGLPHFILASASPARRRLLQIAGIEPTVWPSNFDESQVQSSDPTVLVQTLALQKAKAVAAQLAETVTTPTLVLGCDSVLAVNREIYGKPADAEEAIARWKQMRGQIGGLYTGHALIELLPKQGSGNMEQDIGTQRRGLRRERSIERDSENSQSAICNPQSPISSSTPHSNTLVRCRITQVHFAPVSDRQIEAYVATDEPLNCAGCFALEGKGGLFVEKLEGCHTNVIGLSLPLLRQMLNELGYDVTDYW